MDQPDRPTVQMLWDIEQIKQLKARYFGLLDTKDWDVFAELFTDDCQDILPSELPKPPQANAEYLAGIRAALDDGVTVHHGHYFETYRKGDDGAWRISSKRNVRIRVDAAPAGDAR